jgi:hypothetical protein
MVCTLDPTRCSGALANRRAAPRRCLVNEGQSPGRAATPGVVLYRDRETAAPLAVDPQRKQLTKRGYPAPRPLQGLTRR